MQAWGYVETGMRFGLPTKPTRRRVSHHDVPHAARSFSPASSDRNARFPFSRSISIDWSLRIVRLFWDPCASLLASKSRKTKLKLCDQRGEGRTLLQVLQEGRGEVTPGQRAARARARRHERHERSAVCGWGEREGHKRLQSERRG